MNLPPPSSLDRVPFRSAWIYAAAAAAWVVLSDLTVALAEGNPSRELWMNIGKGLLFVLVSSGLLYVLLSRQLAREQAMRQELAAAQERFNSAVAQLPFTFAIYDSDRRFRFLNARGLLEAGKPLGDVLGRRDEEVFPLERVNAYLPALLRALETRQAQTEVVNIAMPTGHAHLAYTFTPLLDADGTVRELLAVTNDMTAVIRTDRQIRRYNRTLTAISAANSVLVRSTNEAELLQGFCDALVGPTGHRLVWVALATPPDPVVRVGAQAGLAGEYLNGIEIRWDDTAPGRGPTGTCIRTGEPVVCHDFRTDEKMAPWRERAAHYGLRSSIAVPLRSSGTVLGAFTLYSSEPNRFDAEEVKLLVELANDLAYGLAAMRRQMALTAAETALVQERRLRESIMAHSTALVYVLDLEGRFLYTNPALDRAVGQPEGSAAGRLRAELLPKEIATAHQANDLKVARGGQPLQFEEGNLEDGASQTYLTVKFPLRDAVGKVFAVGGVSTNVTALKQSEAALKREQQRLANVIEATAIGTWEWNVQTGETVYNERWAGMLGYTLAELAPVSVKTWGELTHPEDARQVMQLVERHFAGELDRVECEYRMRHKAGHWVWISDSSRLLTRTPEGKPLVMIGTHRDITQRKQTELALQESEHRQRELAEGLAMAQVAGNIGSWETDALSLAIQWSEQTHRIFETSPATFTPTHAGFISRVHPDDRAAVDAAFRNSLAKAGDHSIEHRIVMPDGRIKVVEERWRIYRDERGQPTRAVGTCQDITERKLAVDALRKSEELLRSVLADQTEIISRFKPSGTLVFVNDAFCRFFGRTAEELIGAQWQPKAVAEDLPQIQAKLHALTPAHPLVTIENRVINGAGEVRWVQFANRGLFGPTGELVEIQSVGRDITERRRAEASLEESQERLAHERALLRELLDSIPDLIFFKDQHSVYLGCNRAFEIYSGMRESELVGKSDLDLVPSEVAEAYRSKDREVLDAGRPQRNEEWIPFKDGGGGQFETLKTPYYGPNGETLGLIGISRDITERKQAEAQIRDALGYLGTLIEASPVGILSYDQTGQTQTANEAAARMVGARVEQLLAQNFRQIKSWQASGMLAAAERTLATRRPERVEAHFTTTFGKEVWLAMQFVPFQRGDAWHLLLLMTDISEQSKAAAQLQLQSAALDAAANAIVITDLSGTILWANAAFTRTTGYTFAEAVGQNPRLLKSGRHPREFYEGMWKTILGGHVWHGEMHNRRKDGTPLEEDATITPVKNAQGVITHFIAIKQDISDKKTLEKQFLRAQRMESIGLLAGGIAHDLNNVLAPILMGAEMLKLFTTDAEMNRQLDSIMQSAERGAGIVKQVLTFARGIEGERVVLHPKHIIKEMVRMVRETFPRNLQLRVDVPNELWPVLGDPTQLHQVLLNLSVNARDAMPDGGELTFSARNAEVDTALAKANPGSKPGPHVVLRVRDTGSGIPAAVMERIWEPFFTTKEVGKGTGLGLPTVLGIVRSHGGFIVVESEIGRGTSFDVYLPAAPQADGAVAVAKPDPLPLGKGELVLVVDDEPDLVNVTRSMLERHGYRVVAANDGTAALAQVSEQKDAIRLVITDILMPFMDGVQFIRALHRLMPGMPVIASSGALGMPGQQDRTDEVHALGVKQILHKPYGVEVLLRAVHAELHKGESVPPV